MYTLIVLITTEIYYYKLRKWRGVFFKRWQGNLIWLDWMSVITGVDINDFKYFYF